MKTENTKKKIQNVVASTIITNTMQNMERTKETKRKIHNIVASTVLAEPMRYMEQEFMVCIRGYLRRRKEDDELFIRVEHAMREAAEKVLLEHLKIQ